MGTVWRAEHIALKQQVALKLLNVRGPQAERTVKRFQREAQIAASIRHRNIVYISDFGTDRDEPYIVMELLQGVPLSERMVVGEPLGVGMFLHLIDETLQGLAAVHAAGVVHRDMKPENIFLVRESDGSMFPKLLDFGVSRSTERGQGHTITREGIVMGTPEYVSPEQARGKPADVRSDIYSLGVVVYEALAGRLPFHADNPADLIVAVLNHTPLPLVTFRPDLGQGLSDLVARAMDRNPDKRFQSAEEMRAAIGSLLATEPHIDGLYLPRRFLAPAQYPSPQDVDADPADQPPVVSQRSLTTEQLHLPSQVRNRWIAVSAVGATLVVLSLVLTGSESNAVDRQLPLPPALAEDTNPPPARVAPFRTAPEVSEISEVMVELFGVPDDALVRSDGVLVSGGVIRFPRDSGLHEIVVEAPGKESWRVQHDAARDGRYAIALVPDKRVSRARQSQATRTRKKTSLLRRPDF